MSIDGIGDLHGPSRVASTNPLRRSADVRQTSGVVSDSYQFSDESRISLLREKVKTLAKNAPDAEVRAELIQDLKQKINDPLYNESALRELAARIAERSEF